MSTASFDRGVLEEIAGGPIAWTKIRRRWRRAPSRLLDAAMIELWIRSDGCFATLSCYAMAALSLDLDEVEKLDRDTGEWVGFPVFRPSDRQHPVWQHPIKSRLEPFTRPLLYPHLVPAPKEVHPMDEVALTPRPLVTDEGVAITVASIPVYASLDIRRWRKASVLNRRATKRAKKLAKIRKVG